MTVKRSWRRSSSLALRLVYYVVAGFLLRASGLFDAAWYQLAYPIKQKRNSIIHYLKTGAALGYAPSRSFDSQAYRNAYLRDAPAANPLIHYLLVGQWRGFLTQPSPPSEADLIEDSGLFDEAWYYAAYPDVLESRIPALKHFLIFGWRENRSPGPYFDSSWYVTRYPEIIGRNPLIHFITCGKEEGRIPMPPKVNLDVAMEVIGELEDLDPELYAADYRNRIEVLEIAMSMPRNRVAFIFERIISTIPAPPKSIVFAPWLSHGGADLVACHAARAQAECYGSSSVLVVLTDGGDEVGMRRLPDNIPVVSFSAIAEDLSDTDRAELVELLVRSLQPATIININSRACWDAVKRRGRRLAHFTRLYAMLFCPDYGPSGRRIGYSDLYLRSCLSFLSGVYFDNATHITEVIQQFGIPPELRSRLITLKQPAPSLTPARLRDKGGNNRLRVLWAGRIARQKNIGLLLEILRNAPQFDFHIWGGTADGTLKAMLEDVAESETNIFLHGQFDGFGQLPLDSYDAFLYTSLWDGLPNVLLEAAAAGLPIVASNSGGIAELVTPQTGWLISSSDDAVEYIAALQELADDPAQAFERANAMQQKLLEEHNWAAYKKILFNEPLGTGGFLSA
ncbi:glycosyltransferase involved in cell wall biosynthesis [Neorhizobium sp. 2083]|uniref:glycosyltransferase family 4 protein n=1 Tax=Neorhizobium sp. 2083 TaxID=2817762 RepID=UPI002862D130|nr:glycosyltransferase family 4 protein [Neorhizobium sp. 2083]MDR6818102.1 glycosyltransferase involved in cell wall biosynthesis [Neorhizobium sp. 2083]